MNSALHVIRLLLLLAILAGLVEVVIGGNLAWPGLKLAAAGAVGEAVTWWAG